LVFGTGYTGIVLAGGKSSRVKGNKSLLEYKGKPLIQHAVDVLGQVCDKVVISSNQNEYDFTGGEVWPDKMTIRAPIVGIY